MSERAVAISRSAGITQKLAEGLAGFVRPGTVICLEGDLGAGKTTFVRGLVRALHETELVVSPTFTLENRYPAPAGSASSVAEVVHVDLYRSQEGVDEELLASILEARDDGAVVAIEWARILEAYLEPRLRITFRLAPVDPKLKESARPRRVVLEPVPSGWKHLPNLRNVWRRIEGEIS